MLKNGFIYRIMIKWKENRHHLSEKTNYYKSCTTVPKTYGCRVQKDDHEMEDSGFIKDSGLNE